MLTDPLADLQVLALIIAANAAPIVAANLFRYRFSRPLDGGGSLWDGRPLLGGSKTLRGLIASVTATIIVGLIIGIAWTIATVVAVLAMAGDLFSSFLKRRLGMSTSSMAPGLDQIPESLFPLLAVQAHFAMNVWDVLVILLSFALIDAVISPLLFKLSIRNRPY